MSESGPVIMIDVKETEAIELIRQFIDNIKKQTVKDPRITEKEAKENALFLVKALGELHFSGVGKRYVPTKITVDSFESIAHDINENFLIIRR